MQAGIGIYKANIPHLHAVCHYVAVGEHCRFRHSLRAACEYNRRLPAVARNPVHARQYPERKQAHCDKLCGDALFADFLQNIADVEEVVGPWIVRRVGIDLVADFL